MKTWKKTSSKVGYFNKIAETLIPDQYYSDQEEGNIKETAKKEAVWGHWEVIGIGEPIFDQKLMPIVAEEVIKILFPCFWS